MAENDFDFKYSHKRESELIEGKKNQGAGIIVIVIGFLLGFGHVGVGILVILIGAGIFAWGKIREWAANR